VNHGRIGDVLRVRGDLSAALKEYEAVRAIMERLARADRSNAAWQHDLAIAYRRFALVYRMQGRFAEALVEARKGRQIMAQAVEMAPGNAQWKKDLGGLDDQIAALERQLQMARQ
jgi:hypothetical protein